MSQAATPMSADISQPTSPDTRERLLIAALKAFGHRDYDAVSTREIVDAAEANISAISYHFGGKPQLYLATAEYLADALHNNLRQQILEIQDTTLTADALACRSLLRKLIRNLVNNLLQGDLSEDAAGFIFREQNHPTEAFDILFARLMQPLQNTYATLLSGILNIPADDKQTRLLTHALMGQILIFRTGRATILRQLGKQAFSQQDVEQVAELISTTTLCALDNPLLTGNPDD